MKFLSVTVTVLVEVPSKDRTLAAIYPYALYSILKMNYATMGSITHKAPTGE
jgi:hypothetical protein